MIPIPEPIKKYFRIENEETLVIRPPFSKLLNQCLGIFGIPLITFLIILNFLETAAYEGCLLLFFITLTFFSYGYNIALPGLVLLIISNFLITATSFKFLQILSQTLNASISIT